MGGAVFELGNLEGRGGLKQFLKFRWKGGGVKKPCLLSGGGGVDFFWNYNPLSLHMLDNSIE